MAAKTATQKFRDGARARARSNSVKSDPGDLVSQTTSVPGAAVPPDRISIPESFSKLGAVREWEPTPVQQLRLWLTGLSGVGKTHFPMSNPEAYVFDFEGNCQDVARPQATRTPKINTYEQFLEHYNLLLADVDPKTGPKSFKHVVFDTFDAFRLPVIQHLTDQYNKTKPGHKAAITNYIRDLDGRQSYDALQEYMMELLAGLSKVGYGWSVVTHSTMKDIYEDDGRTRTVLSSVISPSLISPIYRDSQYMLHILRTFTVEQIPIPGKFVDKAKKIPAVTKKEVVKVRMQLQPTDPLNTKGPLREVKGRYLEHLPKVIDLPLYDGWAAFTTAYNHAIKLARSEGHNTPTGALEPPR